LVATAVSLVLPAAPASAGTTWTRVADTTPAPVDPAIDIRAPRRSVIVQGRSAASRPAVRRSIVALHGSITADLPLIDGFTATLSGPAVAKLAGSRSVRSISGNRIGRFEEFAYDEGTTASSFVRTSGAASQWATGNLGESVGVAVLDTGIADMPDLRGRIVQGPDLSGEGKAIDSYGHGTVMAGIIAGSGADSATRAGGAWTGVAPKAHVVSVKVAGRNGVADVSTVLQGLHWVAAYKDQYNIRVLNLSWGTPSTQSPDVDPLNFAVQRLWDLGIVVVVAAGNSGPGSGTITKPGDDPVVLTVGAYDDKQNTDPVDDSLASWSSRGPTPAGLQKPDIIAPGRFVIAPRAFGSKVEQENPKALQSPSYIRGSGTSQAAAVTSGLVALLLEARPLLTPSQVKALLMTTASPLPDRAASEQGKGRVRLAEAVVAPIPAVAAIVRGTGLGSLHKSRGGLLVTSDCGNDKILNLITGEMDVRCEAWNPAAWTGSSWTGSSWTGSSWTGSSWTGSSWTGSSWTGSSWTGSSWTGGLWSGSSWTGSSWTGSSWTGSSWTGSSWTGSSWTGSSWTSTLFSGSSWTTGVYDEFLTAFWGTKTPATRRLPGEPSEELPTRRFL
jgi:serine protease AprX